MKKAAWYFRDMIEFYFIVAIHFASFVLWQALFYVSVTVWLWFLFCVCWFVIKQDKKEQCERGTSSLLCPFFFLCPSQPLKHM